MPFKKIFGLVDTLSIHQKNTQIFPFFLESSAHNAQIGRYDILFFKPQKIIIDEYHKSSQFLTQFDQLWKDNQIDEDDNIPNHLPFRGGWFVFFSYELAAKIEPKLKLQPPPYPISIMAKVGAAIIVDKVKQCSYITCDLSEKDNLNRIVKYAEQYPLNSTPQTHNLVSKPSDLTEDRGSHFLDSVTQAKNYIKEGDVFQVNLSRKWQSSFNQNQLHRLYQSLRLSNPAPFSASCHFADIEQPFSILSSSPERLVSVTNQQIETRPIAGTRPKKDDNQKNQKMLEELKNNLKEQAEHIMLIDLERNDLGKICQAGSVSVSELMIVESYAHVHHIVSNIIGKLKENITPSDVICAVFPGGTITGCPKVRCMEIIYELEKTYRGAYTGSLGYINHNGDMDTNILIRTFVYHQNKLNFRAGAGIVYDSIPKQELKETQNKAKGLLGSFD